MILDRARRPLAAFGIVLLVIAAVAMVAVGVNAGGPGFGMTCSDGYGCHTDHPVLLTVMGFTYRICMPLLVAGVVFLAGSQTLTALGGAGATETDGRMVAPNEPKASATRHMIAVRLWVLAGILIAASTVLGLWSASPAGQAVMMAPPSDGSATPAYILNQLSYALVPAGMLAGLLVAGLAVLVTRARLSAWRAVQPVEKPERNVWDGESHDPFMRPGSTGDFQPPANEQRDSR